MAATSLSQRAPAVQTEMGAQSPEHCIPPVEIIQGHPAVTSLQVSESFGKDHKHVLRDIEQILSQLPEIFIKPNFGLIEVPVKVGFGIRMDKAYALSRDAFSLVVMGFTGKEALVWKVRYIEAFNAMEKALTEPKPLSLTPFPRIKTLPKSRRNQLSDLVLAKLAHVPPAFVWKTRMSIWAAFNAHFSIPRYNLLPEARMAEALTFLSELEVGPAGTVARRTPQLPLPVDDARRTIAALSSLVEQAQSILAALPAAEEAVQ